MALCLSTYFVEGIPGHDISEANLQYHSAVNAIPVYFDTNNPAPKKVPK
jgi:hypothetical protein